MSAATEAPSKDVPSVARGASLDSVCPPLLTPSCSNCPQQGMRKSTREGREERRGVLQWSLSPLKEMSSPNAKKKGRPLGSQQMILWVVCQLILEEVSVTYV